MTFVTHAGVALPSAALSAGPALAETAETSKAAGTEAISLFIQTAPAITSDSKALHLHAEPATAGESTQNSSWRSGDASRIVRP